MSMKGRQHNRLPLVLMTVVAGGMLRCCDAAVPLPPEATSNIQCHLQMFFPADKINILDDASLEWIDEDALEVTDMEMNQNPTLVTQLNAETTFSHMVAMAMAMNHLFGGDGSVVPDLAKPESKQCLLPIPADIMTSLSSVNSLVISQQSADRMTSYCDTPAILPCASVSRMDFVDPDPALMMLEVTGVVVMPVASSLPRHRFHRTAVHNDVSMLSIAQAMVEYLVDKLGRTYISVLHDEAEHGTIFAQVFRDLAVDGYSGTLGGDLTRTMTTSIGATGVVGSPFNKLDSSNPTGSDGKVKVQTVSVSSFEASGSERSNEDIKDDVEQALNDVYKSGYHTIIVAVSTLDRVYSIAEAAQTDKFNLVGEEYMWVFADVPVLGKRDPLRSGDIVVGSPLDRLLQGATFVQTADGFAWKNETDDPFLQAWRQNGPDLVEKINEHIGFLDTTYRARRDYFETHMPSRYSSFVYDATVAMGLAFCKLTKDIVQSGAFKPGDVNTGNYSELLQPTLLVNELLNRTFEGASGTVRLNRDFRSRDIDSVVFVAYNFRPGEATTDGTRSYHFVKTALRNEKGWSDIAPHYYYDGTTTPPQPLVEVRKYNYLDKPVRIVGLTVMSSALLLCAVCGVGLFLLRRDRQLRIAQPSFLVVVCFGSAITALTILPLSFDESHGWSSKALSAACTSTPWFFFVGYMTAYLALFSKLWRLQIIIKFGRDRRITMSQVLAPFALFIFLSVVTLTLWTFIDPYSWVREQTSDFPLETFGQCASKKTVAFFLPLTVLIVASTVITATTAWRIMAAAPSPELGRESYWIFYAISVQTQAWIVGVPLLLLLQKTSRNTAYIGYVMIIWTFSVSMVVLVVLPRIIARIRVPNTGF